MTCISESCRSGDAGGGKSFTAEAIIANPVCYGHIHCAEKLGCPLHIFFTMPYTPTTAFPSPLTTLEGTKEGNLTGTPPRHDTLDPLLCCLPQVAVRSCTVSTSPWNRTLTHQSNGASMPCCAGIRNYLSYWAMDDMIWSGIGHVIRRFRTQTLGLTPLRTGAPRTPAFPSVPNALLAAMQPTPVPISCQMLLSHIRKHCSSHILH